MDEGIMMEGWLYLIRSNSFGFKYSRKLYYVLQNHHFKSFKSVSHSYNKVSSPFTLHHERVKLETLHFGNEVTLFDPEECALEDITLSSAP